MTVVELRVKLPGGPEGRGEMIAMHLEDILRRYGWAEVRVTSAREEPDGEQMSMMGGRRRSWEMSCGISWYAKN